MALTKVKLNTMVTGNLPDANIPNNITIDTASAAPASGLTGNTLASGVTASSLTSVGSLTGLTIAGTGVNAAPNLAIDNSSSSSYIHSIEALGANMTQGQTNIINLGKIGSTKNSAVIGYKWDSADSNNNLLTFEHWGTGALITMDGVGNTTVTGNVTIGTQQGSKELMTNRARMRHIDGVADANASFSHGDLYVNHISTGNIYMQRNTTFAANIITASSSTLIAPNTSDGSDNKRINIAGGGNNDVTRGAVIEVFGNEYGDSRAGQCHIGGMVRMGNGSRTTGDDQHRTLSLGGRPSSNTYVTLGFDSGDSYRGALDFKADSGDFSYYVYNGGWLQSFSINNSRDISFFGAITSDQSGTGDYANTAFLTQDGNNNNGLKISHGGGNGKLEIYGGNQSRTQFYANQITANVNGLEIKTTDAQSLTLGTNNTTRMIIDSAGRAEFKKLIHRVNTEQQQQTNLMSCFHWDHPGTDSVSFFDFNPVLDLGLRQEGGSFFLKISGWPLDRFFGLITYRNNGGSGDINSGSHSMDTIVNDGFSVTVTRPSGNLIRIQLTGHHNNNHAWDMMAFSAPFVT